MTAGAIKQAVLGSAPVRISIEAGFGWQCATIGRVSLWSKIYGDEVTAANLAGLIDMDGQAFSAARLRLRLQELNGHFALAALGPGWAFAAVDQVRSIPVAFARAGDCWIIDDQALRLRDNAGLKELDGDAVLQVAMAGYTVDIATLYRGLNQLGPGEFVWLEGGKEPRRERYHCYRPWRSDKPDYHPAAARARLSELTLEIVDNMMQGLNGRELVVPLSAGRDSRLIVSAARHLGYKNVRCFAYGRPGNFEAQTSKTVAERLGYPWRFVPTGVRMMRRHFESESYRNYISFADTAQSIPFVQDLPQVDALKSDGFIPPDAVLCNGNSGDYISGAHIVPAMQSDAAGLSPQERMSRIVNALINKHFSLWRDLKTPDRCARIGAALRGSIARAGAVLGDSRDDYGIYEYAEFQDRQCRYVITGERIYEFAGHEWRLPLWDKRYLDFWENVPLQGKLNQTLYAETLDRENWGGVWQGLPVNRKTIKPEWIRPIRLAAKIAHAPFGRDRWHRFERRFFQYWMSPTGASASVPYWRSALDRKGARHGVAWLARAYLMRHGVAEPQRLNV
jgi:asparagine synthase (glutamine-hydrolysing)